MKDISLKDPQFLLRKFTTVFQEPNLYQAALAFGGVELLITVIFCELYMSHCLDVDDQNKFGQPRHRYKLRDGIDSSLFNEMERIVAQKLEEEYLGLEELIDLTSAEIEQYPGMIPWNITPFLATGIKEDALNNAKQFVQIACEAFRRRPNPELPDSCN